MLGSMIKFILGWTCLFGFVEAFNRDEWMTQMKLIDSQFDVDQLDDRLTDILSLRTDDVIVMPPGLPTIIGIEDYKTALKENQTGENFFFIKQLSEEIIEYTNNYAIFRVETEVKFRPDSEIVYGKGVALLRKSEGKALVQVAIWNYDS